MDFNNNNFFGNGGESRRDQLEIGNDGKTTAERKQERYEEQQRNFTEMGNNSGFNDTGGNRFFNKFRRGKNGQRYQNTGKGSNKAFDTILGLVLISVPIVLVVLLFTGNLNGVLRSAFSSPEQNLTAFNQGVYNVQNSLHDSYLTDAEQEQLAFYRKNEISRVDYIDMQTYPEYLVFVYSDSEEKNKPFVDFILEAEANKFPVPIFRISAEETVNYFVTDTIGENEPALLIYRNNTGENTYDSAVNDPALFNKLEEYVNNLIKEDDEAKINSRGSYGEAEWLQSEDTTNQESESES